MVNIEYLTFEQVQNREAREYAANVTVDVACAEDLEWLPKGLSIVANATVDLFNSRNEDKNQLPIDLAAALEDSGKNIRTLRLGALAVCHDFWGLLPKVCPDMEHIVISDMEPSVADLKCLEGCVKLTTVSIHRSAPTALHFAALLACGNLTEICLIENEMFLEDIRAIAALDTPVRCILDDDALAHPVVERRGGEPAFGISSCEAERRGAFAWHSAGQ